MDKIMTDQEWAALSAEARHAINMMQVRIDRLTAQNKNMKEALTEIKDGYWHNDWGGEHIETIKQIATDGLKGCE